MFIAGSSWPGWLPHRCDVRFEREKKKSVPETKLRPASLRDARREQHITPNHDRSLALWFTGHLAAVVLFSMFTTCTRRFTSAIGWLGSFSLLLP
jgi:hypothetical protein